MSSEARHIALMVDYLRGLKDDHTPDGYPAVRMSTLTECEDMLRTQAARIAELEAERFSRDVDPAFAPLASNLAEKLAQVEAERDQLRAEVERLRPNARRYEFLQGRMCGADFDWNENGIYGLVFELPKDTAVSASCDDTIDRAIEAAKEAK